MKFLRWLKTQKHNGLFETNAKRMDQDEIILINEQSLRSLFSACEDVKFEKMSIGGFDVLFLYCEGLCDTKQINEYVLPQLQRLSQKINTKSEFEKDRALIWHPLERKSHTQKIVKQVFSGEMILWLESFDISYSLDIANPPSRKPEEPNTEVSNRGPRDGFIEDITSNVALIRKRLPTNLLYFEQFLIGVKTKTKIGLLYLTDSVDLTVIQEVKSRLSQVDIEGLISSTQLEELLQERTHSLFPLFSYTGRPDFAVDSLLRGRFVLVVDGAPTILIAPVNFTFLLNAAEDANVSSNFLLFERMLRYFGCIIAIFLPGFWIALSTFHQEQFPFTLLASLAIARQGIPFPAPLECFLMLLLFELFREAGLRLPSAIARTLSVVGGLIIGQAAISAGLTSSSLIVIVAISVIATFNIVNQSLAGLVSILRFSVLILSSVFGLFGFFLTFFALLTYLVNLRSFGTPFFAPFSPAKFIDIRNLLLRNSQKIHHPFFLHPKINPSKGDKES